MNKWNMIVDVEKCENCANCVIVTKDEHVGNDFPGYAAPQPLHGHNWVDIRRNERGQHPIVEANFMPVMCNHCDNAPCIEAGPPGAVYRRPDGIVIIDPVKAKGQKQIVDSCPYGAIFWNDELDLPQKWIFDAHLLDAGWTRTRIEQACGPGALRSIKVDDTEMKRIADSEGLEVLKPELNTRPRVYYRNLHLMQKCFVGGTVVTKVDGREECLAEVKATLVKGGQAIGQAVSDIFGEFKIDKLDPDSGAYKLTLEAVDGKRTTRAVQLGHSQYLGVFEL
jgi:Fe-S-cluster-containing dehydrogenase component